MRSEIMNKQEKTRVHVVVRKGMVEEIYSNDEQIFAVVIDYDLDMSIAERKSLRKIEQEIKDKDYSVIFSELPS
jgi:hypothetical protein